MLIIKRYKRKRSGREFWEYKIFYQDPFNRERTKVRKRGGFSTRQDAEDAAAIMMGLMRLPYYR
jgi:hypothetical protein